MAPKRVKTSGAHNRNEARKKKEKLNEVLKNTKNIGSMFKQMSKSQHGKKKILKLIINLII
jgi:hypothetical protein